MLAGDSLYTAVTATAGAVEGARLDFLRQSVGPLGKRDKKVKPYVMLREETQAGGVNAGEVHFSLQIPPTPLLQLLSWQAVGWGAASSDLLTFTGVMGISEAEPHSENECLSGLKAEVVFGLIAHLWS